MRGKRLTTECGEKTDRITPAGAGKTGSGGLHAENLGDHPRRCGENLEDKMRVYIESRITPAGAGKTLQKILQERNVWDHPRRCGENSDSADAVLRMPGSPPQVRGKRQ